MTDIKGVIADIITTRRIRSDDNTITLFVDELGARLDIWDVDHKFHSVQLSTRAADQLATIMRIY